MSEAAIEFFNMLVALIALSFAIRILPSISRDVRKRSWLFLSLAAVTFGIAEVVGVLKELGYPLDGAYELTEAVFVILFAIGFYFLNTTEHRETLDLKQQSNTDYVTSLHTHRFFETFLAGRIADIKQSFSDLSILFLDIDNFKDYNDTFGHQEGDYVLRKVAQTISAEGRDDDMAFRYGGEEFTMVLGCSFDKACRIADRLRSAIEIQCRPPADPHIRRNVTVSIGLASYGRDSSSAKQLVQIADARMYMAKRKGKNRVYGGPLEVVGSSCGTTSVPASSSGSRS